MKPDVLMTWPSGVDYPLCRLQLKLLRPFFKDILVSIYEHGSPDFREFLRGSTKGWKWIESPALDETWRETAVNFGLDRSTSDWVLFLEQDFFIKDSKFLDTVYEATKAYDVVGIRQGNRLHPCFLLVSRKLIDKTSRDFAVHGQDKDHFQKFSEEVLAQGKFIDITELGLFPGRDWYHFSSMTWNLFRIKDENVREMHDLPEFLLYNAYSRTKKVPQDPRWIAMTFFTETLLTKFGKYLNL